MHNEVQTHHNAAQLRSIILDPEMNEIGEPHIVREQPDNVPDGHKRRSVLDARRRRRKRLGGRH